jgi:hypothetical protein
MWTTFAALVKAGTVVVTVSAVWKNAMRAFSKAPNARGIRNWRMMIVKPSPIARKIFTGVNNYEGMGNRLTRSIG